MWVESFLSPLPPPIAHTFFWYAKPLDPMTICIPAALALYKVFAHISQIPGPVVQLTGLVARPVGTAAAPTASAPEDLVYDTQGGPTSEEIYHGRRGCVLPSEICTKTDAKVDFKRKPTVWSSIFNLDCQMNW